MLDVEKYDNFRSIVNPILIKLFYVELVKITMGEEFIGVGIRKYISIK